MDPNITILSLLCLLFLMMSAFFSASEMALFSIPRERVSTFQNHASRRRRLIYSLLVDGQRTLLLILLGNLFVNITLAGLINSLVAAMLGKRATFWSFLLATAAIIVFGEIAPKNWALRRNERIAAFASPALYYLKKLTSPALDFMQAANRFFLNIFKVHLREPGPFITIDEVKSAVRSSFEKGVISKAEHGVISNILDKGAQPVKRFMIHRSKIPFMPHYTTASDALEELNRAKLPFGLITRDPRGRQVMGIVHVHQLLGARGDDRCRKFALPPQWAPETLEAADLISFMFAEKLSVVCVIDEFGGTSGAFSLADGIGRVMNSRSAEEGNDSAAASLGARVFPGTQEIDAVAEWLPRELAAKAGDARTLNGLITRYLGRIPKTGERFDIGERNFYIMYSADNRIESILIKKSKNN